MSEYDIEISPDGLMTITPDGPNHDLDEFVDAAFWKDLYYECDGEWYYLVSRNLQLVFPLTDYGWDLLSDIRAGQPCTVMGRPASDYEDADWN